MKYMVGNIAGSRWLILLVACLSFALASCKKDEAAPAADVNGAYIELSPIPGRMIINFTGENQMSIQAAGSDHADVFYYEITGDSIRLTPVSDQYGITVVYFKWLTDVKFEIGNLLPSIPELPAVNMVFSK
ncbi:hypothetical protein [Flavihumibacter petaseus]|nr:hypothetical protein [Flavihumibacter petaseus]